MVGMRDVAKKAGVSLSSVSLVINGTGYVSQDMRDKVEQAMRELNYVPNELARNFYHGKTGIVGVIVPTIQHPFFATLTAHLQREFAARSLRTMLCSTVDSASGEAQYVEMLRQRSLDALVVAAHTTHDTREFAARSLRTMLCSTVDSASGEAQYVEMLRQRSLDALVVAAHTTHDTDYWTSIERPIVAFDRNLGAHIAQVSSDHAHGGELIADLLASTGARNVAIVGGPRAQFTDLSGSNTTFPTVRYVQTLEKCLSQTGIAHTYVESGEVCDLDGVWRAVHGVFNAHPGIDAFVGADLAAAFAMQEATMRGIAVPGQLQIVAYDGTMAADCAGLPLTVVRQDFDAIAHALAGRIETEITAVPGQLQIVAYDGTMAADCAGLPLTVVRQDFDAIAHALAGRIETEITRFAGDAQSPMTQTPEPEIVPVTLEARTTTR